LLAPAVRERLEVVDLGEVLRKPGGVRRGAHDIVVFKSVGVGIEDIAIAALAYRRLGLQR
jgi:ornithine cyclodeaminase